MIIGTHTLQNLSSTSSQSTWEEEHKPNDIVIRIINIKCYGSPYEPYEPGRTREDLRSE